MNDDWPEPPVNPLPPVPKLVGARVTLRPFQEGDLSLVEQAAADEYITNITSVPSPWSPAEGRAYIERQFHRPTNGQGWPFVIERTTRYDEQPEPVGHIGVWLREVAQGHLTFGYWIVPAARGRGLAGPALATASDWAFRDAPFDRHRLYIEQWNIASQRTGERSGFERRPDLSGTEEIAGEVREMFVFERTRPA